MQHARLAEKLPHNLGALLSDAIPNNARSKCHQQCYRLLRKEDDPLAHVHRRAGLTRLELTENVSKIVARCEGNLGALLGEDIL